MKKKINGTITIEYELNEFEVPSSFDWNEIEEYIKDNMDDIVDWENPNIKDTDLNATQDIPEDYDIKEPEDNTYSGGIYE